MHVTQVGCGVVGRSGVPGGVNFILGQILPTISLLCFFYFLRVDIYDQIQIHSSSYI